MKMTNVELELNDREPEKQKTRLESYRLALEKLKEKKESK